MRLGMPSVRAMSANADAKWYAIPLPLLEELRHHLGARPVETVLDGSVERVAELWAAEPRLQCYECVVVIGGLGCDLSREFAHDRWDIRRQLGGSLGLVGCACRTAADLLKRGLRHDGDDLVALTLRRARLSEHCAVVGGCRPSPPESVDGHRRVRHGQPRRCEVEDFDRRDVLREPDLVVYRDATECLIAIQVSPWGRGRASKRLRRIGRPCVSRR